MTKSAVVICALAAQGIACRACAFTLFDDFGSGGAALSVSPSHTLDSGIETGSMIGGTRFNYLLILSNPGGASGSANFNPAIPALTETVGNQLATETFLRYGGSGEPDLNADLSGSDRLRLAVRSNDLPLQVVATMATHDSSNVTHTVQQVLSVSSTASPQNVDFLFSAFSTDSAFQIGNVDQIAFQFNNSPGGGYSVASLSAVPEPASLGVLVAGLATLCRVAKRRYA